jgi:hypothetical protein
MPAARKKRRLRKRWLQDAGEGLNILHVRNWKAKAKQNMCGDGLWRKPKRHRVVQLWKKISTKFILV